jgi:5-methylcytosine-specific restriction protein A
MPWDNSPDARRRSDATYRDPEYLRNRPLAFKRAGGRCEQLVDGRRCGSRNRAQVDHIVPVTRGGTHHPGNLRVLCKPHHDKKTAQEGGGYRRGDRTRAADPPLQQRTAW